MSASSFLLPRCALRGVILAFFFLLLSTGLTAKKISVRHGTSIATVSRAIEIARPGDEIIVAPGTYHEGDITVDKRLRIRGEGMPFISGGRKRGIFRVAADSVWITDLAMGETGYSYVDDIAAIKCSSSRGCRFENLEIRDAFFGIYFARSSHGIVRNCSMLGNAKREASSGNGVHLWYCDSMHVEGNRIARHRDGIYLEFTTNSTMRGNTSRDNLRYGLHFMFSDDDVYEGNLFLRNGSGVAVMYTRRIEMRNNIFQHNWGSAAFGLLLKDIYDSVIEGNHFERNSTGIYAEGGARLSVSCNRFRSNGWAIRLMANCTDNVFTRNTFEGNSFDVTTNSSRNFSRFSGNYWDGYRGYDLERDGTGDVPYRPVRIFSTIVEKNPAALILLNSLFITILDVTEKIFPTVTPETLVDAKPLMSPPSCVRDVPSLRSEE